MRHIIPVLTVMFWVVMVSLPTLAGEIPNPDNVEIVDAWLTSNPQPGVRYHMLKVCQDQEMSLNPPPKFEQGPIGSFLYT